MKKTIGILLLAISAFTSISATGATNGAQWSITQQDTPKVSISQGTLTITAPAECQLTFEIYSITGQLVKRFKVTDGSASVELHKGCYIVRCEKWSKKIVIS